MTMLSIINNGVSKKINNLIQGFRTVYQYVTNIDKLIFSMNFVIALADFSLPLRYTSNWVNRGNPTDCPYQDNEMVGAICSVSPELDKKEGG